MVARSATSALALLLLGCSTDQDVSNKPYNITKQEWIKSPSGEEEILMDNYARSLNSSQEVNVSPLMGKRVSLMYSTNSGPNLSGKMLRPSDYEIFEKAQQELWARGAYVLPHGVLNGNYERDIAISRGPNMTPADSIVIADRNPVNLGDDLKNVYLIRKDGNKYSFEEARKQ
jgi:hypothetical protein